MTEVIINEGLHATATRRISSNSNSDSSYERCGYHKLVPNEEIIIRSLRVYGRNGNSFNESVRVKALIYKDSYTGGASEGPYSSEEITVSNTSMDFITFHFDGGVKIEGGRPFTIYVEIQNPRTTGASTYGEFTMAVSTNSSSNSNTSSNEIIKTTDSSFQITMPARPGNQQVVNQTTNKAVFYIGIGGGGFRVKIDGAWREPDTSYIKINNAWKEIEQTYIKVDGNWKEVE